MAERSTVSPKNRSLRSPSYNARSEKSSDSDGEGNVSRHDYNTRYNSNLSSSYTSSQDDSLQGDNDGQERSYSRSPLQPEQNVRSRVGTRTKGSPSMSPRSQRIYPDLSQMKKDMSGDGPDEKNRFVRESLQPDLQRDTPKGNTAWKMGKKFSETSEENESSSFFNIFLWALAAVLLVFVVYAVCTHSPKLKAAESEISVFERYVSGIEQVQNHFPQQSPRLWRTLKSSAKHVLNASDSEYPVVVLMASPTQNFQVTKCIAQKVASLYQTSQNKSPARVGMADIEQYKHLEDAVQKEALDNEMTKAFSQDGSTSFVIVNLQALAPEAALILHSFCDNDNAPHKEVMILMTLHYSSDEVQSNKKQSVREEDVEGYLRNLWERGLVADKVGALLSRVANNIVIIAEEEHENYLKICRK